MAIQERASHEGDVNELLAKLPDDVRALLKDLPEHQIKEIMDKLLVGATLEYRPLTSADVDAIRERTAESSQYGFLPVDVDFTWPELSRPSYVAIGAFDEQREGDAHVPVGFLIGEVSVLPAAAGEGGSNTAGACGSRHPHPAAASPEASAVGKLRLQRQRRRQRQQPRTNRVAMEDAARLLRAGAASAGDVVFSVYYVGVDYEYRRQGIGQQLLKHARDVGIAAGAYIMWLTVAEYNPKALAFYDAFGFCNTGQVKPGERGDHRLLIYQLAGEAEYVQAETASLPPSSIVKSTSPSDNTTRPHDPFSVDERHNNTANGHSTMYLAENGNSNPSQPDEVLYQSSTSTGTSSSAAREPLSPAFSRNGFGFGGKSKQKRSKGRARATQFAPPAASAAETDTKKLWGGRFTGKTDPLMEKFNESLPFDKRMWAEDLRGSQAYAKALAKCKILTKEESDIIVGGLSKVAAEWEAGSFVIKQGDEDIHTANERRLTELVGPVGGKLHTGRSRNDQVATDTRLWLSGFLKVIRASLHELIRVAADRAAAETDVLMPGFTHLQPAMTVRWSHWVLSHASAWQRDDMRLRDLMPRVATLPLGSGALAGNPFGVDRQFIARELGMVGGVCPNSMDAVSDRDYVMETLFFASLLTTHLSRWAEDLIIYSSGQFGFVQCSDAYATGSSLMPQKKNPDALELVRGKAGRLQGNLMGALAVVKGTPTTYNKDFQECWPLLFDSVDTVHDVVRISTGVLSTLKIRPERMLKGLSADMLATDLAEYLVRKGVPFRETHHISGAAVKMAEERSITLFDLSVKDLKTIHPLFEDDVTEVWDYNRSAEMRDTEGGASKRSVLEQIEKLRTYLAAPEQQL